MEKKQREANLITLKSFWFYICIYFVEILVNFKVNLKQSVLWFMYFLKFLSNFTEMMR